MTSADGFRGAVVGATGAVGREMLRTLAERGFPVREVAALASGRSVGQPITFDEGRPLRVQALESFDFAGWDLALFRPGAAVSAVHAPRAAASGCLVIDNTSQFRMEPDVPLVVPEVNPEALSRIRRGIVANPNCSTIQMLVALKPLHDLWTVRRVVVATYQSGSGAGKDGMDELHHQTKGSFVNDPPRVEQFTKTIAFNCIPHIDRFMDDGSTREEWKMAAETRKILDPDVQVFATCVRVPVFIGHAEAVVAEFADPVDPDAAARALRDAPGVVLHDPREDSGYATPAECVGEAATYVSRRRRDPPVPHGLGFWCVADNLRKGAALNAVQIAETLVATGRLARSSARLPGRPGIAAEAR